MPLVRCGDGLPGWCELEGYEILRLAPGEARRLERRGLKEKLFVAEGGGEVAAEGGGQRVEGGGVVELGGGEGFEVVQVDRLMVLVHAWGRWGEETGASGVFSLDNSPTPRNTGDPASYPRQTDFDRHYHDCDEYWIVVSGSGLAVSEGVFYVVRAGDCIATGMGHHHDFPVVLEPIRGVYIETTLEGEGRPGHLWEHTHGPARPALERC